MDKKEWRRLLGKKRGRPISVPPLTGNEHRDLLIKIRLRHNLSQRALAKRLQVSTYAVTHWENGLRPLSIQVLNLLKAMAEE